jgi:putative oxidoreductase
MSEQLGKLVLRLGLGGLILFHGVHKLLTGLDPVKTLLSSHNLPEALAYAVYLGELVAPLLIIVGLFTRIGAFLIALEVLALVILGGIPQVIATSADGAYALEVEALYFSSAVAVLLFGAGRISLGRGRWS